MIRKGELRDINSIVEFQMRMAMETENLKLDENVLRKGVKAVFENPERGHYYIAESETNVMGSMLTTYEWSDWRNGTIVWLQSVYILPEYRGQKLFSKMYDFVKHIFEKDASIQGIRLYVDKTNLHAQKVYKSIGMTNEHYHMFEWIKTF
jgi:ribosomal protein S18 acetylase RimI-like enzyme